jgi:GTPase
MTHTNKKNKIWPDIVSASSKIVHLLDMCGHEKYLKTTMHGLTSLYPDYCLLVVAANRGITKMTREHLGISLALNLPVFIVFTKIDLTPPSVYQENLKKINKIMR